MAVMLDRTSGARPALNDLINFYGPSKTVPTIPYEIALAANPKQLKEIFRGKIVFVGLGLKSSTGPAQRDAFTTPFDGGTYGIEIHATIASNLLNDDWIRQPPLWMGCVWNALVAAAIAFLLLTSTGAAAVIAISGLIAAVFGLQFILFLLGCFLPVLSGCLWGLFSGVLARVLLVPDDVGPRRGGL
jgi:adenylate cyclase